MAELENLRKLSRFGRWYILFTRKDYSLHVFSSPMAQGLTHLSHTFPASSTRASLSSLTPYCNKSLFLVLSPSFFSISLFSTPQNYFPTILSSSSLFSSYSGSIYTLLSGWTTHKAVKRRIFPAFNSSRTPHPLHPSPYIFLGTSSLMPNSLCALRFSRYMGMTETFISHSTSRAQCCAAYLGTNMLLRCITIEWYLGPNINVSPSLHQEAQSVYTTTSLKQEKCRLWFVSGWKRLLWENEV